MKDHAETSNSSYVCKHCDNIVEGSTHCPVCHMEIETKAENKSDWTKPEFLKQARKIEDLCQIDKLACPICGGELKFIDGDGPSEYYDETAFYRTEFFTCEKCDTDISVCDKYELNLNARTIAYDSSFAKTPFAVRIFEKTETPREYIDTIQILADDDDEASEIFWEQHASNYNGKLEIEIERI